MIARNADAPERLARNGHAVRPGRAVWRAQPRLQQQRRSALRQLRHAAVHFQIVHQCHRVRRRHARGARLCLGRKQRVKRLRVRVGQQCKAYFGAFARRKRRAHGDGGAGIEHIAHRIAQRHGNAARAANMPRTAREPFAIRFEFQRAARRAIAHAKPLTLSAASAPPELDGIITRQRAVHEQVLKRRMRAHVALGRQRDRHAAGQRRASRLGGAVFKRDLLIQRAGFRRYIYSQPRLELTQRFADLRRAHSVYDSSGSPKHGARAAVQIAEMQIQSLAIFTGQQHFVRPHAHLAAAADRRICARAAQQLAIRFAARRALILRVRAPYGRAVRLAVPRHAAARANAGLFLQQQLQCARRRKPHEAGAERAVRQEIADARQDHALMMRHMARHQRRHAVGIQMRIIGGFTETIFAKPAQLLHARHVSCGSIRRQPQR